MDWFVLKYDEYVRLEPDSEGVLRSPHLARPCLDTKALLAHDRRSILTTLELGLQDRDAATATPPDPMCIQWQRNGVNVPGADGDAYAFPLKRTDEGARPRALVAGADPGRRTPGDPVPRRNGRPHGGFRRCGRARPPRIARLRRGGGRSYQLPVHRRLRRTVDRRFLARGFGLGRHHIPFPPEALAGEGTMVGPAKSFPRPEAFVFTRDGEERPEFEPRGSRGSRRSRRLRAVPSRYWGWACAAS